MHKLHLSGAINYGLGSIAELLLQPRVWCERWEKGRGWWAGGRGWHHKAVTSCVFPINQCLPHNLLSVNWDWPVSWVSCQFSAAVRPHRAELCAYAQCSFWAIPSPRSWLPHSSLSQWGWYNSHQRHSDRTALGIQGRLFTTANGVWIGIVWSCGPFMVGFIHVLHIFPVHEEKA